MNKICIKTATMLVVINLAVIFYLNFTSELTFAGQFLVLPWLAIQSLFVLSMANGCQGES